MEDPRPLDYEVPPEPPASAWHTFWHSQTVAGALIAAVGTSTLAVTLLDVVSVPPEREPFIYIVSVSLALVGVYAIAVARR